MKQLQSQLLSRSAPKGFSNGKRVNADLCHKILNFIQSEDKYKWTDSDGNITRYTINYGWDYTALEFGKYTYKEIPPCIQEARKAVINSLNEYLPNYVIPQFFDNIIVTIYDEGQYLIPHYDADNNPSPLTKRNFSFAEPIIGWVIQADTESSMTFYHHNQEGRPQMDDQYMYKAEEEDGSTFLIDKECRHFPYFHSIPKIKSKRISMTLRRTLLPDDYTKS